MKIENLKQLKELIQLCQKSGVKTIEIDGIVMSLGDAPVKERKAKSTKTRTIYGPAGAVEIPVEALPDVIDTPDALTDEQLLFYSSDATPGEQ